LPRSHRVGRELQTLRRIRRFDTAQVDRLLAEWDKPMRRAVRWRHEDGRSSMSRLRNADLDHDVKISPTTVFHVASMSKQFTAASVLLLGPGGKNFAR